MEVQELILYRTIQRKSTGAREHENEDFPKLLSSTKEELKAYDLFPKVWQ